jgi:hypothetical protein
MNYDNLNFYLKYRYHFWWSDLMDTPTNPHNFPRKIFISNALLILFITILFITQDKFMFLFSKNVQIF